MVSPVLASRADRETALLKRVEERATR